ncbi:hypothetical protein ACWDR3_40090 [Streptomyces sp. NPDC001002]
MTVLRRWCRNCLGWQDFQMMNGAEKAAVREEKGARHYVDDLWRCAVKGCVRYQPAYNAGGGGDLPEKFREEKAAASE